MENNQFPQLEPEETTDLVPSQAAAAEEPLDAPVIEEMVFSQPVEEEAPAPIAQEEETDDDAAFIIGQAPPLMELPAEALLPLDEAEPELPSVEVPMDDIAEIPEPLPENAPVPEEFMAQIPDVEEDYPQEEPAPEVPDPALEIINDPEFAYPVQPQQNTDEVDDQEYRDNAGTPPATPEEKKSPYQDLPTRKGRPKRKKGEGFFGIPNILATFVWMALIVAIGVTLGRMLWVCAADVLAFGREDKQVTITVYEADTMDDIVDKLYNNGLIRYKSLFNLYADISDAEEDIKPGIYDLNTRYDYHALVNFMSPSSSRSVIELTIPEGYTCRQIFALLEENRVCTIQDIASYAADGALSDYWFLNGVERGSEYCLEGYLFPDTYQFYKNSTPREALEKMLDNFGNRFSEEMQAQLEELNANVTDGSFDVNDVVIVASLIEKESAAPAESAKIAGVIYNRLFNWEYPALLNIDAAIIYAQGGESDVIDTGIDSPYNTYRNVGLTPTPIANPGLSSLKAALKPESHEFYYYLLNPETGMHQFSTTQGEHDSLIAAFYE